MAQLARGALAAALVLACSSESEPEKQGPTYGVCDRIEFSMICMEVSGAADLIESRRTLCSGGIWSDTSCPPDNLVGCCEYDEDVHLRECLYAGTTIAEPEAYCATFPGSVWTPGGS